MDNPHLNLLTSISGQKIKNVHDWEYYRREEIMVLLSNFIYGVRPMEKPDDLKFSTEVISENYMDMGFIYKRVTISFGNYSFPVRLYLPQTKGVFRPLPVFLHVLNEQRKATGVNPDFTPDSGFMPIKDITDRGYAYAIMSTLDISPDWNHCSNFKKGIFGEIQPDTTKRDQRSWATISGWAWGASRVMDYFETDKDLEHTRVGIVGFSRAGKTALWAGATDPRFSLVISNASGCAGASLTRGKTGERIKDINVSDWFCGNYHKFDDNEEMLPCDQHMLLAAIAPRPLYVKSCDLDDWAGPDNELESCRLASKVYELYGLEGVKVPEKLELDTPYHDGMIAYHRATGDHDMTRFDWKLYLDYADKHLKKGLF